VLLHHERLHLVGITAQRADVGADEDLAAVPAIPPVLVLPDDLRVVLVDDLEVQLLERLPRRDATERGDAGVDHGDRLGIGLGDVERHRGRLGGRRGARLGARGQERHRGESEDDELHERNLPPPLARRGRGRRKLARCRRST
jgi:hypothetical protein